MIYSNNLCAINVRGLRMWNIFTLVDDLLEGLSTWAHVGMAQRYVSCCGDRDRHDWMGVAGALCNSDTEHREKWRYWSEYRDFCIVRVTAHEQHKSFLKSLRLTARPLITKLRLCQADATSGLNPWFGKMQMHDHLQLGQFSLWSGLVKPRHKESWQSTFLSSSLQRTSPLFLFLRRPSPPPLTLSDLSWGFVRKNKYF